MVKGKNQHCARQPLNQGESNANETITKIGANTPYDFSGKGMTPYGGLLPLATMLEKLNFKELVEETVTIKRKPRSMTHYQFILGILLGIYIGFDRLSHLGHIAFDPIITGILRVTHLVVQSSFWRFLKSLQIFNVQQFRNINQVMMQRVWQSAHITLKEVTIDTDTTVNTIYGKQDGGRKGYNPKNRGKKSYQPILTFIAETGEYLYGQQRTGDNLSGEEIAKHLRNAFSALPKTVEKVRSRADAGFYCHDAVEIHHELGYEFIIVAAKTSGLIVMIRNILPLNSANYSEAVGGDFPRFLIV